MLIFEIHASVLAYEPNTHELIMQHQTEDDMKRKKSIAFKAAMEEETKNECSSNDNAEDEDMAMIVRRFKRFIGRKKRFNQKFPKKGEISKDRDKEKSIEKDQVSICYECKKSGYLRQDCPLHKKAFMKKIKKALFDMWSDDEVSSSSDEEETMNIANLCLMGLEEEEV